MQLGAFELDRVLGRGGMGEVWAARHQDGWHAAVKVLTAKAARVPQYQRAFRSEVRAVAGLNHPSIVAVYERGESDGDKLPEGSPYLVMEKGVGTLRRHQGALQWSELREVLLTILDALAHSHAQGILHRDLKPSNVLQMGDGSLRLTDFGLVYPMGAGGDEWSTTAGTPSYMAPEQIRGEWRLWGPWTDLYSLGCVAWSLACGAPPFVAETNEQVLVAHIEEPVAVMRPVVAVGAQFEHWVARLLQKDPQARYFCAADAAHALRSFVGAEATELPQSTDIGEKEITGTVVLPESKGSQTKGKRRTQVSLVEPLRAEAAPLVSSWRRESESRNAFPRGVGLGLYGLRALPLVGRETERDELWGLLCDTYRSGRPRIALVRGTSGAGKTQLSTWIAERAHEVGAATWLLANHEPVQGRNDGLVALARRHLHGDNLKGSALRSHVREWAARNGGGLTNIEASRLLALVSEDTQQGLPTQEDRNAALTHFFRRVTFKRPLVLICDDIQWGRSTLAFVEMMMRDRRLPIFAILTAREESVDKETNMRLSALAPHTISLNPLPNEDHERLVSEYLGLGRALATEVVRRTAGNPLFAIQLVGDWVERGVLEASDDGFVRRSGVSALLPASLHSVWATRVDFALRGRPEWEDALGVAAALGQEVDWSELLEASGIEPESALDMRERLADAQLLELQPHGFAFTHGMLRESIERTEREADRWLSHHHRIAEMLHRRKAPPWREGLHRLAASDYEQAVELLAEGTFTLLEAAETGRVREIAAAFYRAAKAIGIGPDNREWAEVAVRDYEAMLNTDTEEGGRLLLELGQRAEQRGWLEIATEAYRLHGQGLRRAGKPRQAIAHFAKCIELGQHLQVWPNRARCLAGYGISRLFAGETEAAIESCRQAIVAADEANNPEQRIRTRMALGLAGSQGHLDEAQHWCEQALAQARSFDRCSVHLLFTCLNTLGEVLRAKGDLDGAREAYEEGLEIIRGTGYVGELTSWGNLGHIAVAEGRFSEAVESLEYCIEFMDRSGHTRMGAEFRGSLLAAFAGLGRWDCFDETAATLESVGEDTTFASPDLAHYAALAGSIAAKVHPARGLRALRLALAHYGSLENAEAVEKIRAQMAALEAVDPQQM